MREWLVLLVTALERYRLSHTESLPQLPLTVELLAVSVVPAVLMYGLANMWLPRHIRLLQFLGAARTYVRVRPNNKRVWYHGLHVLAETMHVQLLRWGLLLLAYLAVAMVWLASVLRLIESRIGRRLMAGSPDIAFVRPYASWIVLILAVCLALLLAVRGRTPRFGGPFGRLPAVLLSAAAVGGVVHLGEGVLPDGSYRGPLLALIAFAVPVIVHCNRRVRVVAPTVYPPAWTAYVGALGDPQVRPLVRRTPKPKQPAAPPANRLQIPNRPLAVLLRTKLETTAVLDPASRSTRAAFDTRGARGADLGWDALTPPLQRLQPGDPRQLGHYTITGRIATGGMGTVYYAEEMRTGRPAAVKVAGFSAGFAPEEMRARLVREIRLLGVVQVFGVAKLLDSGTTNGTLWVAMEYVRGPTLEEAVGSHGRFANTAYLRFFAVRLAEIIGDLHASGVMHRDIKPSNIILTPDGPVVIDLGISIIAQESARLTSDGRIIGTLSYLPPEILLGRRPTPAGDVYAWGCVTAYAARGDHLFNGPDGAVRARILDGTWDEGAGTDLERRDGRIARLVKLATRTEPTLRPEDGQHLLSECRSVIGRV